LSPTSATAGGPAFTLTVNGTNFMTGSIVRWNGAIAPPPSSPRSAHRRDPAGDIARPARRPDRVSSRPAADLERQTFTITGNPCDDDRA